MIGSLEGLSTLGIFDDEDDDRTEDAVGATLDARNKLLFGAIRVIEADVDATDGTESTLPSRVACEALSIC